MRVRRVAFSAAALVPLAVACASFSANPAPTGTLPDAAASSAQDARSSVLADGNQPPAQGDSGVDAGDICATISDEFERDDSPPIAPNIGGPWDELVTDQNKSTATIIVDKPTNSRILQSNADPDQGNANPSFAFLRTKLEVQPKSITCGFAFRPDRDFVTGSNTGSGRFIDIMLIAVVHDDGTKTLLRFSYHSGSIEIRDEFVDDSDECIDGEDTCADKDLAQPATGMAEGLWSTMSITTDFITATFMAVTGDSTAKVEQGFPNVGQVHSIQLYLGVINFGDSEVQLGSYDHFHCELHC